MRSDCVHTLTSFVCTTTAKRNKNLEEFCPAVSLRYAGEVPRSPNRPRHLPLGQHLEIESKRCLLSTESSEIDSREFESREPSAFTPTPLANKQVLRRTVEAQLRSTFTEKHQDGSF